MGLVTLRSFCFQPELMFSIIGIGDILNLAMILLDLYYSLRELEVRVGE